MACKGSYDGILCAFYVLKSLWQFELCIQRSSYLLGKSFTRKWVLVSPVTYVLFFFFVAFVSCVDGFHINEPCVFGFIVIHILSVIVYAATGDRIYRFPVEPCLTK